MTVGVQRKEVRFTLSEEEKLTLNQAIDVLHGIWSQIEVQFDCDTVMVDENGYGVENSVGVLLDDLMVISEAEHLCVKEYE